MSDLIYLHKLLHLPLFERLNDDDDDNERVRINATTLEQLTNLVLAAQIASLVTLAAQFKIESHNSSDGSSSPPPVDDLVRLLNFSVRFFTGGVGLHTFSISMLTKPNRWPFWTNI